MELMSLHRADVPELLSWFANEAELLKWAGPSLTWPLTAEQFTQHLQAADTDPPTLYPLGLYEANVLVGYCELSDFCRVADSAKLSRVVIRPDRSSLGLGLFMVRRALVLGFEQLTLHRIGLGVFDFNSAAVQCYERAGFTHEGTLRDSARMGDERWNCHIMSILRHEWDRGRSERDPA